MTVKRFQILEEESEILRKIAGQYARDSREHVAIERAATALAFAVTEDFEKFAAFLRDRNNDLTEEQKAHIKRLGLDAG